MGDQTRTSRKQSPTERELRVLRTVVEQQCIKHAARSLGLSPRTVDHHLANLRRKSGRSTVTQLWLWAQEAAASALPKCALPGSPSPVVPDQDPCECGTDCGWKGVSDAQWAQIAPSLPSLSTRGRRRTDYRSVVNGILFKLLSGCSWEKIPRQFCARSTGARCYGEWVESGAWQKIWREFYAALSTEERREWATKVLENGCVPHVLSRRPQSFTDKE